MEKSVMAAFTEYVEDFLAHSDGLLAAMAEYGTCRVVVGEDGPGTATARRRLRVKAREAAGRLSAWDGRINLADALREAADQIESRPEKYPDPAPAWVAFMAGVESFRRTDDSGPIEEAATAMAIEAVERRERGRH